MKTEMRKFEKTNYGWNITFEVDFNDKEALNCDLNSLETIGDYEIEHSGNTIIFNCAFQKEELHSNETIEERLELIREDIESLATSCLK